MFNISTVSNLQTITTATYNTIQAASSSVLSDFYGGSSSSVPITASANPITADQWIRLYNDIDRSLVHQTGAVMSYTTGTFPDVNNVAITTSFVNAITNAMNTVYNNTGTLHAPSQLLLATTSTGATYSKRETQWGSTLTHVVNYFWNSEADVQHFFNLGGRMVVQEGYVHGSGNGSGVDLNWAAMIDYMQAQLALPQNQFTATNYYNTTQIQLTTSTDAYNSMSVRMLRRSSTSTQAEIKFNTLGTTNDIDLISTATFVYSRGDTIPQGIAAPKPKMVLVTDLGDGGNYAPFTRLLTIPYLPSTFTWTAYDVTQPALVQQPASVFPDAAYFPNANYSYDGTTVILTYKNRNTATKFILPYGIPPITANVTLTGAGGGGGGGGAGSGGEAGGAGAGGGSGYTTFYSTSLVPAHSYIVTIGIGGKGGPNHYSRYGGGDGKNGFPSLFFEDGVLKASAENGYGGQGGIEYGYGTAYGGTGYQHGDDGINGRNGASGGGKGGDSTLAPGAQGALLGYGVPTPAASGTQGSGGAGGSFYDNWPGDYATYGGDGGDGVVQISFDCPQVRFYNGSTSETDTSSIQGIMLKSSGNNSVTITSIDFTNNGSTITPTYSYSWGNNFPIVIAAGDSEIVNLRYSGYIPGSYNNAFTISSNNDLGPVTVLTEQSVEVPAFSVQLSPTNVNQTVYGRTIIKFNFSTMGYNLFSYIPSLDNTIGFTINATAYGLEIIFDPANTLPTGSYSTNLSVTGYNYAGQSATTTTNVTLSYALPNLITGSNLGSWYGPTSTANSIVGMSYDVINGDKYLTVGIGAGGEGSTVGLAGTSNIHSGSTPLNLGVNADQGYLDGMVLYNIVQQTSYSDFLKTYGASIAYNAGAPAGIGVTRSYTFTANSTQVYNWSFAVADRGYFQIDGVLISDLRNSSSPNTQHTGQIYLTAGEHTVTFYMENDSPAGGIAIRIYDPISLVDQWSTIVPIRDTYAYRYWQEVYRVPLTQGAYVYNSKDYYIKDSKVAAGASYGSYFSNGSIFTVTDDGGGNLDIRFNAKTSKPTDASVNRTVTNLPLTPYYYLPATSITARNTQLESSGIGIGGIDTHLFTGFDNLGTVTTSQVRYPTTMPNYL